ncbi:tRNA (adenosine(37)-N6)-threonylcarbamoyltransferase complex ATPase subunit type 1 TsaE [Paenibacillus sp. J2TS4]|uniref:tRNA (adenosine(37)-N6)-threonylcarbamoyltransferase complex ATPase subunit type 1 TsaE n=1 Tax=Paenibacillus sp. J2TS4 TaxID=2807194 RepID=UPI001B0E18F9|nr:tRNA (adenosine(37)-N6)-threonylcarbamoyltransferase complex ATPase subunit type 1 TsaE [Paenibacillus sp. J2TS4]GIP35152.1 tRNA threonylcarbamoyladenosine biosynthesis protein TsaE [Paenibacillus sp. J2TS4]
MITTQAQFTYYAANEQDTSRLAEALVPLMAPGTVLALDGDLGAGKTTFSQALAKALGVTDVVNSPTFTIIKEYEGKTLPFYHMDVYRISEEEADELGLDEYFYGGGVTVVEWASRIDSLLPAERLTIYIETEGLQERRFHLTPEGQVYMQGCETLKQNGVIL